MLPFAELTVIMNGLKREAKTSNFCGVCCETRNWPQGLPNGNLFVFCSRLRRKQPKSWPEIMPNNGEALKSIEDFNIAVREGESEKFLSFQSHIEYQFCLNL